MTGARYSSRKESKREREPWELAAGVGGGGARGWTIQLLVIIFAHLFSLRRNSGLGSQSRLFCPVPNTVRALIFLLREDFNLFFPGRLVSN